MTNESKFETLETMNYVIIDTHDNPELHSVALDLVKKLTTSEDSNGTVERSKYRYIHYQEGNGTIMHSSVSKTYSGAFTFIDMETAPVSKLIEALKKKSTNIRINNAYEAEVKDDKSGVQVGCTFVSKEVVKKIYDALK